MNRNQPPRRQDSVNGVLLVDKPAGLTSHDVVNRLRRLVHSRRVGHSGTLDPMAEGLLVLCLGTGTRIARFLVGLDKVYLGTIRLGGMSSTYDAEGKIIAQERPLPGTISDIEQAMAEQIGEQIQLPPPYSAVKVRGKKLYEYARAGEEVPEKPRTVHVHRFQMLRYEPPDVAFETKVASGTYVRSMAHDLGLALGCGGYLSRLCRTRVGAFSLEAAVALKILEADPELVGLHLLSMTEALGHLPKVTIHPRAEDELRHGRPFSTSDILELDGILNPGQPVLVLDGRGQALSVVEPIPQPAPGADGGRRSDPFGGDAEPVLGATPMVLKPLCVLAQP